ncbi:inorganic phosphate transporter [Aquipseudomonas alcaligenes]|uniref:inorganic phosphate transporter n=1 Tax=Aquipseudomonas alcaligenes TaxID=43263 RepID=UPI00374A6EC3
MLDRYQLLDQLRAARLPQSPLSPVLQKRAGLGGRALFLLALAAALTFTFLSLAGDLQASGELHAGLALTVLVVALLIALGFEFINGFHDAANAVATVIYTNALPPNVAVLWSGLCNGLGVLLSSGAVAFAIVALLPAELMLHLRSGAGMAMIFALLIAAILWNLGTWWLGLPVSSSHTLIGSIVGVALAHGLMAEHSSVLQGDWHMLSKVGYALLLSPLVGLGAAALLLWLLRLALVRRRPALFQAPEGRTPPPWWIRGLLILTCSGVSFAHGSNDGQKGMGLIMLILVGAMPLAFALDRASPPAAVAQLVQHAEQGRQGLLRAGAVAEGDAQQVLLAFQRSEAQPAQVLGALATVLGDVVARVPADGALGEMSDEQTLALRDDLFLAAETVRLLDRSGTVLPLETWSELQALRSQADATIHFVPPWVKIAVALALCLGTLVGWRRIVATVGEGIGTTRMTYAQGASAQLTAMLTIGAADLYGMPVSTTQVLSSGVAGTMLASGSGLQWQTIRSMLLAWVLTLPAAILLSGGLYWLFSGLL